MRFLLMVSHGTLASGFQSVLAMLAADHPTTLSCSLEDGMGADAYRENLSQAIAPISGDDEVVLMGDIIGGSPLTNAVDLLAARGLLDRTIAFGGMNLPMAMTAALELEAPDLDALRRRVLSEGHAGLRELALDLAPDAGADGGDDEDI